MRPSATMTPVGEDHRARAELQGVRQVVGDHQGGQLRGRAGCRRARAGWPGRGCSTARPAPGSPGSIASTVATATRRRWPKDRWCGGRSTKSSIPTWSSACAHARVELGTADAEVGRAERDVLADRRHEQLVVRVLEDDADPAADLAQVRRRRPAARPPSTSPCPPRRMPLRCRTRVVLPAPFGPSRATRSPRSTREVDAEQRLVAVGVGEGEAAHDQRREVRRVIDATVQAGDGDGEGAPAAARRRSPTARGSARSVVDDGHRAVVAAAEHRQVHPLAAFVGADEQARRPTARRPCRWRTSRPWNPRDSRAIRIRCISPPITSAYRNMNGHDLHHQLRQAQPLQAEQQAARLGRGGQQDRRHDAERPLGQDVPGAEQPGLAEPRPEHLDRASPRRDERQQHREQHERHLDDHPARRPRGSGTRATSGDRREQHGVDAERPELLASGSRRPRGRTPGPRRACTAAAAGGRRCRRAGRARASGRGRRSSAASLVWPRACSPADGARTQTPPTRRRSRATPTTPASPPDSRSLSTPLVP